MNLRTVILAFLAARYPAAYDESAILQRVNKSGLLEASATQDQILEELRLLSNRFKMVEPDMEKLSGKVYWTATEAGVLEWNNNGRPHVG